MGLGDSLGIGGFIGDILNVAPAAIPGVGGYLGAKETNEANTANSAAQMAFQERMSNTAHQREVEDLKKAGLNPILAAQSGASSPVGAAPQLTNPMANVSSDISAAVSAYMQAVKTAADTEYVNKQTGLLDTQKAQMEAGTEKTKVEKDVISKDQNRNEMINDIWGVLKPYSKKLKEYFGTSGKSLQQRNQDAIRQFNNLKNNVR